MRGAGDGEQTRGGAPAIALRHRQRGTAEQLLDGTQVAAASEQVGGEGMAERMWRRRLRQAEQRPQPAHLFLRDGGIEPAPARAEEERTAGSRIERTGGEVSGNRLAYRRQDRHHSMLAALAADQERVADGRLPSVE